MILYSEYLKIFENKDDGFITKKFLDNDDMHSYIDNTYKNIDYLGTDDGYELYTVSVKVSDNITHEKILYIDEKNNTLKVKVFKKTNSAIPRYHNINKEQENAIQQIEKSNMYDSRIDEIKISNTKVTITFKDTKDFIEIDKAGKINYID